MLVLDEKNKTYILNNINTVNPINNFWVLDLDIMDFTLAPLPFLEQIEGKAIQISIMGFAFTLPSNWNILIVNEENHSLDVVEISDVAGKEFKAVVNGVNISHPITKSIVVRDLFNYHIDVGPSLNKNQLLCHPISPDHWVCVTPYDPYNKYLKYVTLGDII